MRTLFIGMDGATFTILDELTRSTDGNPPIMPFLSRIYKEGVRGKLKSTPNPLTPPAWVSLMTGKQPGNHGIYDFIRAEERGGDVFFTLYDARDCLAETIWSIAGRQNKKVAALNFPFTAPPPRDLNGFMVPGFIPWRHLRRNTVPKDLYDRLANLPGFNPKELAWDFTQEKQAVELLDDQEREDWVRYHLPREKQWFRISEFLLSQESPDLMAVMFDGVDKLQHQAWRFMDPACQKGTISAYHRRMRQLCLDYFKQLDQFLESLFASAGKKVRLFMASDHGFTATFEIVRINAYLHEKGYLKWKKMPDTEAAARREDSMFANLDWQHTTAYCRTPSSNGITIRTAGKNGEFGINPKEYESFRDQLVSDLEQLKDPETGQRIIKEIHRREHVFPGPAMEDAPDLLLVLRDSGFVSIKDRQPVVEKRTEIAGTHHPDGVFFAYGPDIKAGEILKTYQIADVGATLLYSLDLRVPDDFDGQVAESAFTEDFLSKHPPVRGGGTDAGQKDSTQETMSDKEKEKLMDQLKMLGYME